MKRALMAIVAAALLAAWPDRAAADEARPPDNRDANQNLKVQLRLTNRISAPDAPAQYIAGENVPFGIRVTGLATDADGKIDVVSRAELVDAKGRTIVPLPTERIHFCLPLGGGELNYGRGLTLPSDLIGRYRVRVTVEDQVAEVRTTEDLEVAVADRSTFGLMNLRTALDSKGELVSDVFPVGRKVFVLFTANGCADRDGQVKVDYEAVLSDLQGNRLGTEPLRTSATAEQSIYGSTGQAHVGMYIGVDRTGEFLLKLLVKDAADGKVAEQVVPILVVGLDPASYERTATTPQDVKR